MCHVSRLVSRLQSEKAAGWGAVAHSYRHDYEELLIWNSLLSPPTRLSLFKKYLANTFRAALKLFACVLAACYAPVFALRKWFEINVALAFPLQFGVPLECYASPTYPVIIFHPNLGAGWIRARPWRQSVHKVWSGWRNSTVFVGGWWWRRWCLYRVPGSSCNRFRYVCRAHLRWFNCMESVIMISSRCD